MLKRHRQGGSRPCPGGAAQSAVSWHLRKLANVGSSRPVEARDALDGVAQSRRRGNGCGHGALLFEHAVDQCKENRARGVSRESAAPLLRRAPAFTALCSATAGSAELQRRDPTRSAEPSLHLPLWLGFAQLPFPPARRVGRRDPRGDEGRHREVRRLPVREPLRPVHGAAVGRLRGQRFVANEPRAQLDGRVVSHTQDQWILHCPRRFVPTHRGHRRGAPRRVGQRAGAVGGRGL